MSRKTRRERWSFTASSPKAFKRSSTTGISLSPAQWSGCTQKESAKRAVEHIRGVRNVFNHITVAPRAVGRDVPHCIVKALHGNADLDAHHIVVTVSGDTATLAGTVGTWLRRESAEQVAANSPGIAHVVNRIVVEPFDHSKMDESDEIC